MIEWARSGRSTCQGCRRKISADELRYGHPTSPNASKPRFRWYHLKCGAKAYPETFKESLLNYQGDVPEPAR